MDGYKHTLFHMNHMVTTNQKPVTDTQRIKRKKSKHHIEESQQITREENKRKRNKELQTQPENN